jgi:hypothetical protein
MVHTYLAISNEIVPNNNLSIMTNSSQISISHSQVEDCGERPTSIVFVVRASVIDVLPSKPTTESCPAARCHTPAQKPTAVVSHLVPSQVRLR